MSEPTPTKNGPEASRLIPPLCALALFLWLVTGPREPAPAAALQDTSTASDPSSSAESDRASQRLSLEEQPESTAAVALTDLLLEAHRSFHARDSAALSLALESILLDPERSLELLDGLAQGRWTESDLPLSAAEDGARLAVGAGAALYSSDESPTEPAFAERFLGQALTSLLKMRGGLAELMARELARAEVEGERVFGARWLPRLLHLRWKHPERSALFDPLLEAACSDEDADGALLARLLLSGEEDPGLLRVALGRLLLEDSLHWMSVARDWFDRARDIETRAALASAVATSAPLEEASRFFADVADPELTGELRALAGRDGGTDELEDLYEERLLSEDDPIGRRAVVSGHLSAPDLCLGLARTAPAAGVRGPALRPA
ncbi:MAG: hypothetical protein MK291_06970, partial [Planctomycetes bacterium]|nr:hypothetical protein [Planctomycetota bacterium]